MAMGYKKSKKDAKFSSKDKLGKKVTLEYEVLRKAVLVLRAVNHPLRKQIIDILNESERLTVTEIYIKLRVEQSVASQHLSVLKKAKIAETIKTGKYIHYSLNKDRLNDFNLLVSDLAKTA